ncbi:MAG: hypothetical protein P8181_17935, partial [bacterium]
EGEHDAAVLYSIVNAEPAPMRTVRTGIPEKLEEIIERSLAKEPGKRYQHITELRSDLETLSPNSSATHPVGAFQPEPTSGPRRRALWGWILGALAVIVIGTVFWIRPLPNQPQTEESSGSTGVGQSELPTEQIQKSVAVLPLTNLSRDDSNEFFVDGMTEELITQLAQIKALKVISRTSIMR